MAKPLIIVESPTKAKTISKFLGGSYQVEASFGHIRDLPKSKLSIDVEHDFEPKYSIPVKSKEIIAKLKSLAKSAPSIILAPDEDREGEAIAWHLVQALDLGNKEEIYKGEADSRIQRIVFHEITKTAIEHALKNPRSIDLHLVDAQQARRVLDRLVGYELSPFLWRKIRYGLSAGRVQSVAVRLIVEREREIEKFNREEYWSIEAKLSQAKKNQIFIAKLTRIDGKPVGKMDVKTDGKAEAIVSKLDGAVYAVTDIQKKEVRRNPAAPFTTSTLQQEAARKLGFSAKQTMVVAQQLYEQGHITYMRTDSLNLAASALEQARAIIAQEFGQEYSLPEPRFYTNKSKGAQEAHEAIRPTDVSQTPDNIKIKLERSQGRLYDLIWKRTIASQMQHAIFDQTTVEISADTKDSAHHTFKASGQTVKFHGFIRAYSEGKDDGEESEEVEDKLPDLALEEKLQLHQLSPLQHFTEPPARFTDATLIKALEAAGVGRPSTYAPTLATIQDRDYANKEDKKYKPTEVGVLVNDMLVENFPEIVDVNFTASVEEDLDKIAEGEKKWVPVIREFYTPFKKHLTEKEASVEKQVEVSTTACPHCDKMMLIKFGRAGKFLACPDPENKITQPLPEEAAKIAELKEKTHGELCPVCSKPMEVKRGRFGFFLGCADYPKCKGISKIWNKSGFKCPACLESNDRKNKPGDIVEKKSRGRGKLFYACTKWPDCNIIINKLPESEQDLTSLYEEWKANPPKPRAKKSYPKKTTK